MIYKDILKTSIQSKNESIKKKREKMIMEALSWKGGTQKERLKYTLATLPNGMDVYFLKPGKEALSDSSTNPNDMRPQVGSSGVLLKFDDIWNYLSKVSIIDYDIFIAILVLIYRNAFLIDHIEIDGNIRYSPNDTVLQCIDDMDRKIGTLPPYGLLGLLHFLNLLGWNEDVKYHVIDGKPSFSKSYDTGRINTLLSCIRVSYQTSYFVKHVIENYSKPQNIDFKLALNQMQQFALSRGVCKPTQEQLSEWLYPYLVKDTKQIKL